VNSAWFIFLNEQEGLAPLLRFIEKKQGVQGVQQRTRIRKGKFLAGSLGNKKENKENEQNYTICSSHELI
jgi:hypothetical protein